MRLREIIDRIEDSPPELCIVAKRPWHMDSQALLVSLTQDFRIPAETSTSGYEYFLEVHIALEEVLDGLSGKLSDEQRFEAVLFYAENDAYPDWLCSIRESLE